MSGLDVCYCGDHRDSHTQNGTGPCKICEYAGPTRCRQFRLYRASQPTKSMTEEVVHTKWGPWNGRQLKRLKDAYAAALQFGAPEFEIDGQVVVTQFAKYLIEYLEGEGLRPL